MMRPLLFEFVYRAIRVRNGDFRPPLKRKPQVLSVDQRQAFDDLWTQMLAVQNNQLIEYDLPYPKAAFLNYLCDRRGYVAHGSRLSDLDVLRPIRLTTDTTAFGKRQQIFASRDAMWAMWFAILDKQKAGFTSNGCIRWGVSAENPTKYYHFDVPKKLLTENINPFTSGTIYLTHASDFPDHRIDPLLSRLDAEIEEWGSADPVRPIARLAVEPADFPYLNQVGYRL